MIVVNHDNDAAMLDTSSGEISSRYTTRPEGSFRSITASSLGELQYMPVDHCAVSADGKRLLLAGFDSWAVFDTAKLTMAYSMKNAFPQAATINACALSADSRWVAVAFRDVLQIWDLSTGQSSTLSAKTTIQSCTFDPKSQWVAFASGDIILGKPEFQIYNLYTNELHPFDNPLIASQRTYLREPLPALDELRCILNCAATPDGTRIFAAHGYGAISVWDVKSLGLVQFWQAHNIGFLGRMVCRPMPDGKTVLTAGSDGAVRLWEVDTGKRLSAIQTEGILEDCAVFPDGRHVVAVGEAGVHWLEVIGL